MTMTAEPVFHPVATPAGVVERAPQVRPLPKISIVTPSFNQAEFLEETLRSVLGQNYPNLEYVVIDAGSTDGSADIIRKYAERLTYWVSEKDKGHADGINKGFARTTGEIMAWINSSDVYYPWTLSIIAQVFEAVPEAQWIMGVPTYLAEGNAPQDISWSFRNLYDFLAGDYAWLQQESVFWRRSLWEAAGGRLNVDARFACDFDLWLRFMKLAPLYSVNTILAGFRYHDEGRSVTGRKKYLAEAEQAFDQFRRTFSLRDRARAQLVRLTDNPPGRIVRKLLKSAGLMSWYVHPRIIYDVEKRYWQVVSR